LHDAGIAFHVHEAALVGPPRRHCVPLNNPRRAMQSQRPCGIAAGCQRRHINVCRNCMVLCNIDITIVVRFSNIVAFYKA
jgi:hypothetical protein